MVRYTMGAEVTSLKCLSGIDADAMELIARPGSAVTRKPIRKLNIPEGAIIGGIVRGEESFIAMGDFQIEENDKVVVFALPHAIHKIEKLFSLKSYYESFMRKNKLQSDHQNHRISLVIEGIFMFTALPFTINIASECYAIPISGTITIVLGGLMFLLNRNLSKNIGKRRRFYHCNIQVSFIVSTALLHQWYHTQFFGCLFRNNLGFYNYRRYHSYGY